MLGVSQPRVVVVVGDIFDKDRDPQNVSQRIRCDYTCFTSHPFFLCNVSLVILCPVCAHVKYTLWCSYNLVVIFSSRYEYETLDKMYTAAQKKLTTSLLSSSLSLSCGEIFTYC